MLTKPSPGSKVRLISNPDKIGVLTGRVDEGRGRRRFEVAFRDDQGFYPEGGLESVAESESEFDLVKNGRFGTDSDLRRCLTYYRLSGRLANLWMKP